MAMRERDWTGNVSKFGAKFLSLTGEKDKNNRSIYNVLCPSCGEIFQHSYVNGNRLRGCYKCGKMKADFTGQTNKYGVVALKRTEERKNGQVVYLLKCPLCQEEYKGINFIKQMDCGCVREHNLVMVYNEKGKRVELNHSGEILPSGVKVLSLSNETVKKGNKNLRLYNMECPICGDVFRCVYRRGVEDCGNHHSDKIRKSISETKIERGYVLSTHLGAILSEKIGVTNTSGFKNVSWSKEKKAWRVYITFQYKRYEIGYFKDIEEAKNVAEKARAIRTELLEEYTTSSEEEKTMLIDEEYEMYLASEFEKRIMKLKYK